MAIVMFVANRHVTHPRSRDSRLSRAAPGGDASGLTCHPGPALPTLANTVVAGAQGEVEHVPLAVSSFGVHGDYTI